MGGGHRGSRQQYTTTQPLNKSLSAYEGSEEARKRAFISFHIEDEAQVNLLRQQAKDEGTDLEFIDYSVKEPFDDKWKTRCTDRLKRCGVCIVMIGRDTHKREAVNWEINKAYELGIPVIGVRIYRDRNDRIPDQMMDNNAPVVRWKLSAIQEEIDNS